jgi:hypothetical protein
MTESRKSGSDVGDTRSVLGVWIADTFLIAQTGGPAQRQGWTCCGLGLHDLEQPPSPQSLAWTITHLNTGHSVCTVYAPRHTALRVATEITECGDWSFADFEGWQNNNPELLDQVVTIIDKWRTCGIQIAAGPQSGAPNRDVVLARSIAIQRAGAVYTS